MKILILDMTHGGSVLAEEYLKRGDEVVCVDVYRIAAPEKAAELRAKGAAVCEEAPAGRYDLLVSPAHCPDSFIGGAEFARRITFSGAVRELISDRRFRIEVTGVKGKTSACYLLAQILHAAGKRVYLHTSRADGPWGPDGQVPEGHSSIAPVSLLTLPEGGYDCMVCEVSLGGSGRADIAAITNLAEDYGIARGTRRASEAKAEALTGGVNVVRADELEFWRARGGGRFVPYGGAVSVCSEPRLGEPLRIGFDYAGERLGATLGGGYLTLQYLEAVELALAVCAEMRIAPDAVVRGLEAFRGVPGRGEVSLEGGVWHVRDRNPGISHLSIGMTLSCLERMGALEGAVAIVDPVSRKVCDKMDSGRMEEVAEGYGVPVLFADGSGRRPEAPAGTRTVVEFVKEGYQRRRRS